MSIALGSMNHILDVTGLRVGHAADDEVKTGVSVVTADRPFTAAVHVMGGAPGTRETDLLAPDKLVQEVDALVLSGGSAFGLEAASGVMAALRAAGRGFVVGDQKVPIVPSAILFDLLNGGNKDWRSNLYSELGRRALEAAGSDERLGTVGAGAGCLTAGLKGGLGSASAVFGDLTVGALVAVNAVGQAIVGEGPHFWAGMHEVGDEFGGHGGIARADPLAMPLLKGGERANTTIAIVATNAALTQAQATRMAVAAHDGMARALSPSHTPLDGDLVFTAATGEVALQDPVLDPVMLGHLAAQCLARAIARGVFEASPAARDTLPTYKEKFGL